LIKAILIVILTALNINPSGEIMEVVDIKYEMPQYPPFAKSQDTWADSVLNSMTVEEKIGQLFMIAAYSSGDNYHYDLTEYYIKNYHIGGLIFMQADPLKRIQGDPVEQVKLTNRYQAAAKIPLLIATDAEWGLAMRLDKTISYPRQLMLGAIQDDRIIYNMGREIGKQHKRMGIHVNFAPVVDVNNNPNNPVINDRSFGENRENVARKGIAYMRGLQDERVMACAKHFPGHGDTDVDSHMDLPVILHDRKRLDSIELYPFRKLSEAGVSSMMVAHLNIPALDSVPNTPSTLSPRIVNGLLKKEIGFNGLVFTDAMNMHGVTKYFETGESSLKSFLAGNDVILFPDDVKAAVNQMRTAYSKGLYAESDLDRSVKKILLSKDWAGLRNQDSIQVGSLIEDLNTPEGMNVRRNLVMSAITIVRDSACILPVGDMTGLRVATVTVGSNKATPFTEMVDNYVGATHYYLSKDMNWSSFEKTLNELSKYDLVLANVVNMSRYASREYGVSYNTELFMRKLSVEENAVLTVFGSPYSLVKFPGWKELIVAYEETAMAQSITAQVIFGGRAASGKLPVSAGGYDFGDGIRTPEPNRLKFGSIEELGYDESALRKVDSIIDATMMIEATPGCQVLVAKNGHVFYNRSFGSHTYAPPARKVKNNDLYDIASITKIVASTALVMKLYEDGRIDLNKTLGDYLDLPEKSNKHDLVLKEILAHQSGLWPWIPFYLETLDSNDLLMPEVYNIEKNEDYPIVVCDDLFCSIVYQDSMWHKIHHSELRSTKGYKYSDLGFYYFKEIIEHIYGMPIENVAAEIFWEPLGMDRTTYKPLEAGFSKKEIVPTETDIIFRGRTIHGYVHDPGAAMMGGVGGHAGVFSNATDMVKIMQMLLNGGTYGGQQYLDSATIKYFTTAHFDNNRRGLGFDKTDPERKWGSACDSASLLSFGHTGFTGTMAFADPEHDLIFIFLSNRVHPSADNKKLIRENSRTQIHQAIYDIFLGEAVESVTPEE